MRNLYAYLYAKNIIYACRSGTFKYALLYDIQKAVMILITFIVTLTGSINNMIQIAII